MKGRFFESGLRSFNAINPQEDIVPSWGFFAPFSAKYCKKAHNQEIDPKSTQLLCTYPIEKTNSIL